MSIILWRIFEKCKKVKNEATGPENVVFGKLGPKCSKIVLLSQTSIDRFFPPRAEKLNISTIYESIFSVNPPLVFIY